MDTSYVRELSDDEAEAVAGGSAIGMIGICMLYGTAAGVAAGTGLWFGAIMAVASAANAGCFG